MDLCRTEMYVVRNLGLDLFVDSFWVFTQDLSNARVVTAFANLLRADTPCASRCLKCLRKLNLFDCNLMEGLSQFSFVQSSMKF